MVTKTIILWLFFENMEQTIIKQQAYNETMPNVTLEKVYKEVLSLRKDFEAFRKTVEIDSTLTPAEEKRLEQGLREIRQSKGISHEQLRKELRV